MMPSFYRRSRLGPGVVALLVCAALTLLVSYLCLRYTLIWLRPGPVLVVCVVACFVTWEHQIERLHRKTLAFCSHVTAEQRRLEWASTFVSSADPWQQLEKMFNELLHPERCVLMGTVDGAMYVRGMKALRCEFDDIVDRRRDFRRFPYDRANEEGAPIYLDAKQSFLRVVEGESQYMAPLKFRGELLGFVVVSVLDQLVDEAGEFVHAFRELADEAAEMLQRRRELEFEQSHDPPHVSGDLTSWEDSLAAAQLATRRLRSYVNRFECIIRVAPTPVLLFDTYGHTLLTNQKMDELLLAEGIPHRTDTMTVLARLWQGPERELRNVIHAVASQLESHVSIVSLQGSSYAFHLTPVTTKGQGISDDVYPFHTLAIRLDMVPAIGSSQFVDWLNEAESRDDENGPIEVGLDDTMHCQEGESAEIP
jgi:hypothetical protein